MAELRTPDIYKNYTRRDPVAFRMDIEPKIQALTGLYQILGVPEDAIKKERERHLRTARIARQRVLDPSRLPYEITDQFTGQVYAPSLEQIFSASLHVLSSLESAAADSIQIQEKQKNITAISGEMTQDVAIELSRK